MTPKYSQEWAIDAARHPKTKFLFFWSHKGRVDQISPAVFSQWFPVGFSHQGTHYDTAEHWMMAEKARLFGDTVTKAQILGAKDNPGKAKALGRQVANFDASIWNREAYGIVLRGSILKFRKNKDLGDYLQTTGSKILVEASPMDPIWGIGLDKDDPAASDPSRWQGGNLLGFALMEARDRLRDGEFSDLPELAEDTGTP